MNEGNGKINEKRLEEMARGFARSILRIKERPKIISLYGSEDEHLVFIKDKMQNYFSEKGQEFEIIFGQEGYWIDVGFFLKTNYNTDTSLY